jgi:large subunit ribosomal protein L13
LQVALDAPRPNRTNTTKAARVPTYSPKVSEIKRAWYVVDGEGMVLGRLASEVARVLRGKHKPIFAPHIDTGDHVVIVNADKVVLTSDKAERKTIYRHSGYPGGIKSETFARLLARRPEVAVRRSIRGMLPKNRLGRQMLGKLKVYAGPSHPHAAQQPQPLDVAHARRR